MARTKQPEIDGKKFCIHCKQTRPIDEFYKIRQRGFEYRDSKCDSCRKKYNARYAKKWHDEHRDAHNKQNQQWKVDNRERYDFLLWRSHIRRKYDLSPEEYNQLIGEDPRCAICGTRDFGGKYGKPLVDHCHRTKKVRGALCVRCNTGIGVAEHCPDWLDKARAYLALTSANTPRA